MDTAGEFWTQLAAGAGDYEQEDAEKCRLILSVEPGLVVAEAQLPLDKVARRRGLGQRREAQLNGDEDEDEEERFVRRLGRGEQESPEEEAQPPHVHKFSYRTLLSVALPSPVLHAVPLP